MDIIANIINAPALFLRFSANVITVATGVSAIAAAVSMTVVITVVIKQATSPPGPFYDTAVTLSIVQSMATLVFNRDIESYEYGVYYNATEALITLVEQLNDYLQQTFPTTFIKIVVSGFSTKPVLNLNGMSKSVDRKNEVLSEVDQKRSETTSIKTSIRSKQGTPGTPPFSTSEPSVTTHNESTELSLSTITGDIGSVGSSSTTTSQPILTTDDIGSVELSSTTTSETSSNTEDIESTSTTTLQPSTALDSSYYSSTYMFSTVTSLFSFFTSTISEPFSTTTAATTTHQTNNVSNCTISTVNSTMQTSLIYLNGTLYFNVTNVNDITSIMIINALKSFYPNITLINTCRNPSTAEGSFNATLSVIVPPSKTNINATDLDTVQSIPSALVNETNSVTTANITTQILVTTTPLRTVATTPALG